MIQVWDEELRRREVLKAEGWGFRHGEKVSEFYGGEGAGVVMGFRWGQLNDDAIEG